MSANRIMALDVGNRRIGLAMTDPLNLTAQPFFTLHRTSPRADIRSIGRFLRKHDITTLVVGDPVHADGSPGPQALKSRAFADALAAEHPSITVHMLDERFTTLEAHALLDTRSKRRGTAERLQRKNIIDQVAATLLLQSFLEQQNGPTLLPDPEAAEPVARYPTGRMPDLHDEEGGS